MSTRSVASQERPWSELAPRAFDRLRIIFLRDLLRTSVALIDCNNHTERGVALECSEIITYTHPRARASGCLFDKDDGLPKVLTQVI